MISETFTPSISAILYRLWSDGSLVPSSNSDILPRPIEFSWSSNCLSEIPFFSRISLIRFPTSLASFSRVINLLWIPKPSKKLLESGSHLWEPLLYLWIWTYFYGTKQFFKAPWNRGHHSGSNGIPWCRTVCWPISELANSAATDVYWLVPWQHPALGIELGNQQHKLLLFAVLFNIIILHLCWANCAWSSHYRKFDCDFGRNNWGVVFFIFESIAPGIRIYYWMLYSSAVNSEHKGNTCDCRNSNCAYGLCNLSGHKLISPSNTNQCSIKSYKIKMDKILDLLTCINSEQ